MEPRTIEVILEDWRAAERELESSQDDREREALQARILHLRDEHRMALAAHASEADELRQFAPGWGSASPVAAREGRPRH